MITALIPLKSLDRAKSRLAGVLQDNERRALAERMAAHTVRVARATPGIDRVALVTPERALAERLGAIWRPDVGELNASLTAAIDWAVAAKAQAALVLPADLPFLAVADLSALIAAAPPGPGIALAATRDGGTGAMLIRPPDALMPAFGPDSYCRHRDLGRESGLIVAEVTRPALSLDLDTPEDLACLSPAHVGLYRD